MLFDALSVGHLTALDMAERDFLQDRAGSGSGGYGVVGGSTYKKGFVCVLCLCDCVCESEEVLKMYCAMLIGVWIAWKRPFVKSLRRVR